MKRIVTGVNEAGRSYIVSIEDLESGSGTLWDFSPGDLDETIGAIDPAIAAEWIGPQVSGGLHWSYTHMLPDSQRGERRQYPGIDADGFHTTRTVDFDVVLSGQLTMVLDEDRIVLEPGDCVVQQATRHAWKNEGDTTAVLLALLHRPETI